MIGLPCNQFYGQEPGSAEEIAEFCSATYGVTFPMTEKIEVNGDDRHEIYAELVKTPNEKGEGGDVSWNFEKFLVAIDGTVVARFSPQVEPDDPRLVDAVKALASSEADPARDRRQVGQGDDAGRRGDDVRHRVGDRHRRVDHPEPHEAGLGPVRSAAGSAARCACWACRRPGSRGRGRAASAARCARP